MRQCLDERLQDPVELLLIRLASEVAEPGPERAASQVVERHIGRAVGFEGVGNAYDRRVVEPRQHLRLTHEPLSPPGEDQAPAA